MSRRLGAMLLIMVFLFTSIGLVAASNICLDRYAGNLDELFIYQRALGQNEINTLFNNPDQIANQDTTIFLGSSNLAKVFFNKF